MQQRYHHRVVAQHRRLADAFNAFVGGQAQDEPVSLGVAVLRGEYVRLDACDFHSSPIQKSAFGLQESVHRPHRSGQSRAPERQGLFIVAADLHSVRGELAAPPFRSW